VTKDGITDVSEGRKIIYTGLALLAFVSFLPIKLLHFNIWISLTNAMDYINALSHMSIMTGPNSLHDSALF